METMTPEEFNHRCTEFYKLMQSVKKSTPSVTSIGPRLIKPIENVISQIPIVECKPGCSYCCNLRVVAFPFEIVAIYYYLTTHLSKNAVEECKSRVKEQFQKIKGMTIEEHFTTNITCPLLVDNKCSVYPVRPLSCAGYHSSSVEKCRDSDENPEVVGIEGGGIPMLFDVKEIQSFQNTVVVEVLSKTGGDSNQYELIKNLWRIMGNPKLIQRWKSGRIAFSEPG